MAKELNMERKRIELLESQDKNFLLELIRKVNPNDIIQYQTHNIISGFVQHEVSITITDIDWLVPFQATSIFNTTSDNQMVFVAKARIKPSIELSTVNTQPSGGKTFSVKEGELFYGILIGAISFSDLDEGKLSLASESDAIRIEGKAFNKQKNFIDNEWDYLQGKVKEAKRFVSRQEKGKHIDEKIEALTGLEELGMMGDEEFMERMGYLLEKARTNSRRVWGEYAQVARTTKQPTLMNKAMAIALNKQQVVGLVAQLSKVYKEQLQAIPRIRTFLSKHEGVIPIEFSTTLRGHADPNMVKIVLPKHGDWRMGYNDMYAAELVFHEFAHVVDFGRKSSELYGARRKATGRSDVHKQDFVTILDNMLLKFKDWIDKNYDFEFHYDQVMNNDRKVREFYANRHAIVSETARAEKAEREAKEEREKQAKSSVGLKDGEYPLNLVVKSDDDVKRQYIEYAVKSRMSNNSTILSDRTTLAEVLVGLDKEDFVLNKEQMGQLSKSIADASRNKFISTLPMKEQLSAMPKVKEVEKELEELSEGRLSRLEEKSDITIEHYDDYLIQGDDDERTKILKGTE